MGRVCKFFFFFLCRCVGVVVASFLSICFFFLSALLLMTKKNGVLTHVYYYSPPSPEYASPGFALGRAEYDLGAPTFQTVLHPCRSAGPDAAPLFVYVTVHFLLHLLFIHSLNLIGPAIAHNEEEVFVS
jgi:hypothetical protein